MNNFKTGSGTQIKPKHVVRGFMDGDWRYTIHNEIPLSEGKTLVMSKIIQRKIRRLHKLFRISLIKPGDEDPYVFIENGSDISGTSNGALTQFKELPDSESYKYSSLNKYAYKMWLTYVKKHRPLKEYEK